MIVKQRKFLYPMRKCEALLYGLSKMRTGMMFIGPSEGAINQFKDRRYVAALEKFKVNVLCLSELITIKRPESISEKSKTQKCNLNI